MHCGEISSFIALVLCTSLLPALPMLSLTGEGQEELVAIPALGWIDLVFANDHIYVYGLVQIMLCCTLFC